MEPGCRQWKNKSRIEWRNEAFWSAEGDGNPAARGLVRTLSELQVGRRALQAKVCDWEIAASRRGRRDTVGENVPSDSGGNRLGHGDYRPLAGLKIRSGKMSGTPSRLRNGRGAATHTRLLIRNRTHECPDRGYETVALAVPDQSRSGR